MCMTFMGIFCLDMIPSKCIRQLISPDMIISAPLEKWSLILSLPIFTEMSGSFTEKVHPNPQHSSFLSNSTNVRPSTMLSNSCSLEAAGLLTNSLEVAKCKPRSP